MCADATLQKLSCLLSAACAPFLSLSISLSLSPPSLSSQAQFGDSRKTVHLMLADSVPGPGFGDLKELLAHYRQTPVTTHSPVRLTAWLGANNAQQVGTHPTHPARPIGWAFSLPCSVHRSRGGRLIAYVTV